MARTLHQEAYACPHCNAYAQQYWYTLIGYPDRYSSNHGSGNNLSLSNTVVGSCQKCRLFSIWLGSEMIYPLRSEAPLPNPEMPPDVRSDYEEARLISALSPKGAAALLRLSIQKLCIHLGGKGNNINDDIKELVRHGLNVKIQRSLDIVRVIGNDAVHPGQIDFDDNPDTALQLFALVNVIVDTMIRETNEIPEEKRKQIEERDKKN
jgi:hypothetical protein